MENIENKTTETQTVEGQVEPKTYTQEEVDKLLQSEADRRVSEALKKQAKKNERNGGNCIDATDCRRKEKSL